MPSTERLSKKTINNIAMPRSNESDCYRHSCNFSVSETRSHE